MNKKKRNTVIAVVSIILVLAASAAAGVNYIGLDNLMAMIGSLSVSESESEPSGSSGSSNTQSKITMTDPLSEDYDWNATEFEVPRHDFAFRLTGVTVEKSIGELNAEAVLSNEYITGPEFDSSGNITNDYTYIKVSFTVQNLLDKQSVGKLTNQVSYGTMEDLQDQTDRNVMTWLPCGNATLVTTNGDNEILDKSGEPMENCFYYRLFEPGETREFVTGHIIKEEDLNKGYQFFYSVKPSMNSYVGMYWNFYHELHPDYEPPPLETEPSDNDYRHINLNPFLEEALT